MIEAGMARLSRGCLLAAFSSYLLSDATILSSFGVLLGWFVELLLMPTLMVLFKPFGPEFEPRTKPATLDVVAQPA